MNAVNTTNTVNTMNSSNAPKLPMQDSNSNPAQNSQRAKSKTISDDISALSYNSKATSQDRFFKATGTSNQIPENKYEF